MKVFTLTLVILLLLATVAQTAKLRRGERHAATDETKVSDAGQTTTTKESLLTKTNAGHKEKELHKRGILHTGAALASAGSFWPKTYASHYDYGNWHLPAAASFAAHPLAAAHLHSSPILKYHGHGFHHYKTLASPAVTSLNSAWPNYDSLSPAVPHAHAVATTQPFIIRPGGAVVQSYSLTYPHRKPAVAVKPIHSFAAVAPVHHVPAVQPVHSYQTVQAIQHVQPVQPVVAPVATVTPIHHLTPVQEVPHLPPLVPPPVQTVVQTSFIPPAPPVAVPALPQAPAVAFSPAHAGYPALPAYPHAPDFPNIPSIPVLPAQPSVPDVPAVPAIPNIPPIPNIPTIPSIPNFPQPQVPPNSFFPTNVQPPLHQNPPAFGGVNPSDQFPGHSPDFGSADASPQIPAHPVPSPEPNLPDANQTPWKPVLYEPPTAESPVTRPSNTLLPPYGSSPAEGYLPPAASSSSHSGRVQQEYTAIDSSLFDNLSDTDIQQIFAQASLAAHRDHHHHTVHNYHTHY